MKSIKRSLTFRLIAVLAGAALLGVVTQSALAAATPSGTTISNTATMNYSVGGVAQTAIGSSPSGNSTGAGAATSFVVDNKVNVTVAKVTDASTIAPNSTNQALVFTVTNNGNTSQRYALTTTTTGSPTVTMGNVRIYRDSVTVPGVWDASDTLYVDASTFGDLAANASLNILIVADTPIAAANGQTAIFNLVATTVDSGALTVTAKTTGADTPSSVDVVFADLAGTASGDSANDGKHSAPATYTVASSSLVISKTVSVLCDPVNGTTSPKNIPGAIVRYSIVVNNAAGASAILTTVTDTLAATVTHDPGLRVPTDAASCIAGTGSSGFKIAYSVARALGGAVGVLTNTAGDSDGASIVGQAVTITFANALPAGGTYTAGELKSGESATITYNAIIN